MVRRPIEEDDENPDRWLVSYADFITLLFAFFVVMYSVSSVNQGKYKELSSSINNAFSKEKAKTDITTNALNQSTTTQVAENAPPPLPSNLQSATQALEVAEMTTLGKTLAEILSPVIKQGNARVIQNNQGLQIDIKDEVLFNAGSADLLENAKPWLTELALPILNSNHNMMVEGHTDNTPIYIQNAAFFSSWELSAVRASSIVEMLNKAGIENVRLSALGYGPSKPLTTNTTEEGRAINRHITIMILYDSISINNGTSVEISPN